MFLWRWIFGLFFKKKIHFRIYYLLATYRCCYRSSTREGNMRIGAGILHEMGKLVPGFTDQSYLHRYAISKLKISKSTSSWSLKTCCSGRLCSSFHSVLPLQALEVIPPRTAGFLPVSRSPAACRPSNHADPEGSWPSPAPHNIQPQPLPPRTPAKHLCPLFKKSNFRNPVGLLLFHIPILPFDRPSRSFALIIKNFHCILPYIHPIP